MTDNKNIVIGKLGRPHGIGGAFRFLFYRVPKSKKKLPSYIMLEQHGNQIPFFIQSIELKGIEDGFIKLEEINTPEAARLFSGKEFYLPENEVQLLFAKEADELAYLVGYKVFDEEKGEIGTIKEIEDSAAQVLATIANAQGKEVIIPLADDFVSRLDKRKKEIYLQLPEGLLDL